MRRSEAIRRRHAEHYAGVLAALQTSTDSVANVLAQLDQDWEQIRRGQQHAAQAHPDLAFYFAVGAELLERRRPPTELIAWIDAALPYVTELDQAHILAEHVNRRGALRHAAGELGAAQDDFTMALNLVERPADGKEPADPIVIAGFRRNLAATRHVLGDTAEAVRLTRQALDDIFGLGYPSEECELLGNLGMYADESDDADGAVGLYEQALEIARTIGDDASVARWVGNLGNSLLSLGRLDEARAALHESLALSMGRHDRGEEALRLGNLASVEQAGGRIESAVELRERALAIAVQMGRGRTEALQHHGLGQLHFLARRWAAACTSFATANSQFAAIGDRAAEGKAAAGMRHAATMARQDAANKALARIQAGEIEQGMRDLAAILESSRADKDDLCESLVLGYLAYGTQLDGRPDEALPLITAALEIDARTDNALLTAQHLRGAGAVHHQLDELDEAAVYYGRAAGVVPTADEARSLGLQVADLGNAYSSRGARQAAIRCYLQAINVLLRAQAPQIEEEVRQLLAANLYPMDARTLDAAALEIANRRNEVAALSVLRTDGILMRGGDYLLVLGHPLQLRFFDETGRDYDLDTDRIAGIAMIGADHTVAATFGLHPDS